MVVDHNSRPAEAAALLWYDSGNVKSESLRGEMGGDDIAMVGSNGLSKEGFCVGENSSAIGSDRKIVDACSRMDEVVVRS
jgi:hypothetical protein